MRDADWPALLADLPSGKAVADALYQFFSLICHQLDARSFHIGSQKLAVCIRCSSIYFAFFLSLLLYPFLKLFRHDYPPRLVLLLAALPMAADVVLNVAGVLSSSAISRVITGVLLGGVLPFYVMPSLQEAVEQLRRQILFSGGLSHARKTE